MKLRNKKTGEILGSLGSFIIQNPNHINCETITKYDSLAELNEEWEDYEDDDLSKIISWIDKGLEDEVLPVLVNDFVEKLKTFKRLQDLGFRFEGIRFRGEHNYIEWKIKAKNELTDDEIEEFRDGLQKVFEGEDESNQ